MADYLIQFKISHQGALPWTRAFFNIRNRCCYSRTNKFEFYGGSGIKMKMTKEDLKKAFYRDRAWLLREPSVDRINPRGHYEPGNIRWIERRENVRGRGRKLAKA